MRKRLLNLVLAVTIVVGGAQLLVPTAARADSKEACCKSAGQECCGDVCSATADGCVACRGWWCYIWVILT